jgi:hypothetical protein
MIEKERMMDAGKLEWYVVRKSRNDGETGKVVDCVKASSIDVAFECAMGRWAHAIERSHDAPASDPQAWCLSVWPMAARKVSFTIVQPTKEEVARFAAGLEQPSPLALLFTDYSCSSEL